MPTKTRPMLITITGPSGTGKDSVIDNLLQQDPQVRRFTTATTRLPRPGEIEGVNYYFMTKEAFAAKETEGAFLETDKRNYSGNWYGTLRQVVDGYFAEGYDVISDINFVGVQQLQASAPERLFKILILPPSRERLEQRLTKRNPDLAAEGLARLKLIEEDLLNLHDPNHTFTNPDMQGSRYQDYDAILVNDVLDHTVAEAAQLIRAERVRRS